MMTDVEARRTPDLTDLLAQARQAIAESRFADARQCCQDALNAAADETAALVEIAQLLILAQAAAEAKDLLSRLVARDPTIREAQSALGNIFLAGGEPARALDCFVAATSGPQSSATDIANRGVSLMKLSRFAESVPFILATAKALPADLANAHNLLSLIKPLGLDQLDRQAVERAFARVYLDGRPEFSNARVLVSKVEPFGLRFGPQSAGAVPLDPTETLTLRYGNVEDRYVVPGTWMAEVPRGRVFAGWDYPMTEEGSVLSECSYLPLRQRFRWIPHHYCQRGKTVVHLWRDHVERVDRSVIFLSNPVKFQLGHWIVDFLQRLRGRRASQSRSPIKFAVLNTLPSRHREFLAQFGVLDSDLFEMEFGQAYEFSSLWAVSFNHRRYPAPRQVKFLHDHLCLRRGEEAPEEKRRRIFLDRGDQSRGRGIANREAFDLVLKELQFVTVKMSDLSPVEQSEVLGSAETVAGIMGTDIAAVFQVPAGANLIVLTPEDLDSTNVEGDVRAFERCAAILGIAPHRLMCESTGTGLRPGTRAWRRGYYKDLIIDCSAFRSLILRLSGGA